MEMFWSGRPVMNLPYGTAVPESRAARRYDRTVHGRPYEVILVFQGAGIPAGSRSNDNSMPREISCSVTGPYSYPLRIRIINDVHCPAVHPFSLVGAGSSPVSSAVAVR